MYFAQELVRQHEGLELELCESEGNAKCISRRNWRAGIESEGNAIGGKREVYIWSWSWYSGLMEVELDGTRIVSRWQVSVRWQEELDLGGMRIGGKRESYLVQELVRWHEELELELQRNLNANRAGAGPPAR